MEDSKKYVHLSLYKPKADKFAIIFETQSLGYLRQVPQACFEVFFENFNFVSRRKSAEEGFPLEIDKVSDMSQDIARFLLRNEEMKWLDWVMLDATPSVTEKAAPFIYRALEHRRTHVTCLNLTLGEKSRTSLLFML